MAKIEVEIQANEKEQSLAFEQDSVTIGRGLGNDILIEDPQVSRYHARLVLEDGALVLYDLRSRNGTRVNAEKVSSCPLRGDESIIIGQAIIRARICSGEQQDEKEDYRPTRHHRVSGVIEVDDSGRPRETSIVIGEKATVELEHAQAAALPQPERIEESQFEAIAADLPITEKDTESALLPGPKQDDEPWRAFENCLAPIMPLVRDPDVDSISIASIETAFVKRKGVLEERAIQLTEGQLQEALRIVSASIKPSHSSQTSAPAFSIRLSDGSELAGAGPALAPPNGVLVITTGTVKRRSIQECLKQKILPQELFYFLHGCVALRKTMLVSGTNPRLLQDMVSVLAECIPGNQRITLVSGYSGIELPQPQVVTFAERISVSAAVLEAASRTRSDRLVVAEALRNDAIRAFIDQSLNGSHGSIGSLRAPTAQAAIARLESAVSHSDSRIAYDTVRTLVRESIQVVLQMYELPNGAPRVLSVSEIITGADGSTQARPIFRLRQSIEALDAPSYETTAPSFLEELELTGFEEAYRVFKR